MGSFIKTHFIYSPVVKLVSHEIVNFKSHDRNVPGEFKKQDVA